MLLPSNRSGAVELLDLIGQTGNARECVISLAEQLERLTSGYLDVSEEDEVEEEGPDSGRIPAAEQLVRILSLHAQSKLLAIPTIWLSCVITALHSPTKAAEA